MKNFNSTIPPKSNRYFIFLICILILAAFLRIYQLGSIPNGFFADEAANGYDSYSILKTGRNVLGKYFPYFFRHHNVESISGIYIYSSIPFIFLFISQRSCASLQSAPRLPRLRQSRGADCLNGVHPVHKPAGGGSLAGAVRRGTLFSSAASILMRAKLEERATI